MDGASVDVMLAVVQEDRTQHAFLPSLRQAAPASLRFDLLSHVDDTGANNGIFLQQLLIAQEFSLDFDLLLKLDAREEPLWRQMIVRDLVSVYDVWGLSFVI